jgi:alpha-L-arabinofuranosidase
MDLYNWYDGIGARVNRSPVQPEKTGLTHHDFGTAEYVDFCRTVGVEPLICIPLYTPGCSDPRIVDVTAAAQLAADWVAYCNADDPHPLAILRERNGLGDPLRVKYWELVVPEAGVLLSPAMLADSCQRTIRAMKEADTEILTGVTLKGDQIETLEALLQCAGKQLDFVTSYAPGAYERVQSYNQNNDGRVMFADTMMQGSHDLSAMKIAGELAASGKSPIEYYINWYRSLGIAGTAAGRLGSCCDGPVCLPYYAEQVLGLDHGSTTLSTDIGLISAMIGRFPAVTPLKVEISAEKDVKPLTVHAAWTEDDSVLVVFVYNPAPHQQLLQLELSFLKKPFTFWIMDQLGADLARVPSASSLSVTRSQKAGSALKQMIECEIGPAAFARILIKE